MLLAKSERMPPRRTLVACIPCLCLVACGHGAQPGAPDASDSIDGSLDDAAVPIDTVPDAMVDAVPPDVTAPKLAGVEPAGDVWLRDPLRFAFDEPIDISDATVTAKLGTATVGATLALEGDRTIVVTLASTAGVGTLEVTLGGTIRDLAQNAATVPITEERTVQPWNRPAIDRGSATTSPALAVTADAIYTAWTVGSPRRVVVSRHIDGAWESLGGSLGGGDTTSAAIAVDAMGRPVVAWIESGTAKVMRWQAGAWAALPSPGTGSHVLLAGDRVAVFGGGMLAIRRLNASDAWDVIGDHALGGGLVGTPAFTGNAAAWITGNQIRALRDGDPMSTITADQPAHVSLASRGSTLAIAWDEHGGSMNVIAALASGTSWSRLGRPLDVDVAGDATAPAIALDANNRPVVAWRERIEGVDRGVIARWTGSAWRPVGGPHWGVGSPSAPVLALRGETPVVGSASGGDIHVARFNGPASVSAGMTRQSIAGCSFNANSPAATLSATGCFTGAKPHAGLVPYDIVNELWSDGTKKRRWIGLPNGQSMTAASNGAWAAPVGTIMVKEFAIETTPGNPSTRRPVETRILVNTASGWRGFSYRWRTNGSDADLLNDGAFTFGWQLDDGSTYTHAYPSRSQCLSCHHGSQGPLLGLRGPQLARWFDYNGTIADQAATLAAIDVGPANTATPYPSTHDRGTSYEQRARAYMAANCAHCHNPNNIAIKDLRFTTPLGQTRLCEVIVPGSPSQSVLHQRVTSRPGMPPIGTLAADPHADLLLTRWISGMSSCP